MATESNSDPAVDRDDPAYWLRRTPEERVEECQRLSDEFYRQKTGLPVDWRMNRQVVRIIRPGEPVAEDYS